ncbi:hypothetical protein A2334_00555 [Candidatus Roizmanbacteria bacterium RIFOXYB2_FULL_38_10]|uniref:Aminoglycoside phosphotransferase domain-containing protein n=1 Tax=Candidatus Roizmanbacteria bacterium RIFOXYD1_FULL_38_12 TaxID=1802093 RepID=A0A1F7L1B0_9BACT|nr:MAG: hypothetical protein A3K47_03825 [Candidatus Roizmanbacteria bacterium RIFOXYA2_FULL_38_14]OGK63886.1 MAG: hypothetical protein A3K27_03825 [Candidatus Roizmanbacteria bacterium RIFOXYA1_FULL_37_12]OGK65732.1 MAG: hypothetical protein A3K38_03825 [Candidatus Roizmanbacteria bacterium RIFOXYB1_FULL_40_23]OGK68177.1 MAG: hypothetical protein A2334_00555 [Candidatus Roizmanbacteria bacterium RIFOXYB2_FULL_38_10]OGK70137.1 MAG: hypothetical protein A3K21_03830 [Candidatus Roizmanbacteria ba
MIKALIFDLGEVVTSNAWHYRCPEKDREFCSYFKVTMEDFERGWLTAWPLYELGKVTEDEFWTMFLTLSGTKKIDVAHARLLWKKYQYLKPGMLDLLTRLHNRYPLVACTNNGKEWVNFYKQQFHLDTFFDAIINSGEVHIKKPDSGIYKIAVEKTGYKPKEVVFIDDSNGPIKGAQAFGLQTIQFKNAKQLELKLNKIGVDTSILDISSRKHSFYWQSDRKISEFQIRQIFQNRHSFFDKTNAVKALEIGLKQKVKDIIPPIKSGSINSVVRARMENGADVIMRMHPNGLKNGYFWAEKAVADAACKAKVPTYQTLFIDDTKEYVPFDYMIISCLSGENMKHAGPFSPKIDQRLIKDTGRLMALTHSIKTKGFGFFDNKQARSDKLIGIHNKWTDHIYASLDDNLIYLQKMKAISPKEKRFIKHIFKTNDHIIVCDSPRLVHNDIADWNQLTDGKKITGFIDWDESFSGDPICDFSTYSVFFDDKRLNNLISGYETVTKLPSDFEEKFHLYRLRYIISKLTLRTKRSVYDNTPFVKTLLQYSQTLLSKELSHYDYRA